VEGAAGHPSYKGGGHKRIIRNKWRAEEEERHEKSLTQKQKKLGQSYNQELQRQRCKKYKTNGPF
jgi:hypothetical protein